MNANYSQAKKFKKMFHKGKLTTYLTLDTKEGQNRSKQLHGSLKKNWMEISKEGVNAFMLINTSNSEMRKATNIKQINAVFIDYDGGDWSADNLEQFMSKFVVKPHLVVNTSPGNYHVYWLIKDIATKQFKGVQTRLAKKFNSDSKVNDLPRVMRMPGTFNWKNGNQFLVNIIYDAEDATPIPYQDFLGDMFSESKTLVGTKDDNEQSAFQEDCGLNVSSEIKNALKVIPSHDRKTWVTVGMALKKHLGEDGLELYKSWSKTSSKFDEIELLRQWNSFKPYGGININTLFWLKNNYAPNMVNVDKNSSAPANLVDLVKLFVDQSSGHLKHSESDNQWYVFNQGRWERSQKAAKRFALDYLKNFRLAAKNSSNEALVSFIERNLSTGTVRELLNLAELDPAISVGTNAFDQIPTKFCVELAIKNETVPCYAVLNLVSKNAKLIKPEDMMLKVSKAGYSKNASCPLWLNFLSEVTRSDSELVDFLQMAVGYTLFGHANEQVMFILIGSGGNGKGVFSNILYALLGDYAAVIQSNLLKPGAINANNPSPALMKLKDKRLWVCSEVPKGMVLDEALTKQITGGDKLSSRQLYGEQVEFQPIGKLWLSVNNMPRVRHDDLGMWRRIIPIPFNAKFTGTKRDNNLESKLKVELPGILNWALEGASKYAKIGKLILPNASKVLLANLRHEVDTVGIWINSRCIVNTSDKLQSQIAYDDYTETMKREKFAAISQKDFKADMHKRGYLHKSGRRFNYFLGITLKLE